MKRMTVFLIMIWVMGNLASYSQDPVKNDSRKTGIKFGISFNELSETLLNNTIHTGVGFSGSFITERTSDLRFQRFELNLEADFLKSSIETETGSYIFQISAGYRYLFNMNSRLRWLNIRIGPIARADINISYFDNWDSNHYYWLTAYTLGTAVRLEHFTGSGNVLQFDFNMPLISLVSRPPERFLSTQASSEFVDVLQTIHENSRLLLPQDHLSFNLKAAYSFRKSRKLQPTLFWQFNYLINNHLESSKIKSINQLLGIEFYF